MNAPRHRFHELVTEKYALLHKQYHSKADERRLYQLSYLLPLIDELASIQERKEYVHRTTQTFPRIAWRKQVLWEIHRLAG